MKTAHFHNWHDFRAYGINFLTGESCAYSMRLLCDLSEDGADLMRTFLGLPPSSPLASNWNSMVGEAPAVASIQIPRGVFKELARFICYHVLHYAYVVEAVDGSVHGYPAGYMEEHGLTLEKAKEVLQGEWYFNPTVGRKDAVVDGRCVHAMSGRSA